MSPGTIDSPHVDCLTSRLNEQRKSGGIFCDVLLKVCGQTLPTHACVLSACSPFFHGLICADRSQSPHLTPTPQEIELRILGIDSTPSDTTVDDAAMADAKLDTMLQLLDYIYTGRIELKENSVQLMVQLAEAFMLEDLATLVKNYTSLMTVEGGVANNSSAKTSQIQRQRKRKMAPRKFVAVRRLQKSARSILPKSMTTESTNEPKNGEDGEIQSLSLAHPTSRALRSRRRVASSKIPTGDSDASDDVGGDVASKQRNRTGTFKCGQCEFVSSKASAILEHKLIHGRSKSFVCRSCGYFSGHCAKMLEHLLAADHPDTSCCLCGTELDDRTSLVEHLRKHQHRKPFFCLLCDARFRAPSLLARHTVRHSSDRPFVCDVCGRGFKRKHFLRSHVLNHGTVKSFACTQCDYRTSFKSNLSMHIRGHEESKLRCPREGCPFQSTSKYNLQSHLLTHAKQKPFQCEVCGEKFAQERNRRRHARRHNPDSMLRCDRCPFATVRPDRLSEHVRRVHENGPPPPSRVRKRRAGMADTPKRDLSSPPPSSRRTHDVWQPQPQLPPPHVLNEPSRVAVGDGYQPMMGVGVEMYPPRMWYH